MRDFCARKVYSHSIEKRLWHNTESQAEGSYFETLCLGSGARGQQVLDLPRNSRNGEKKSAQQRLDIQHLNFLRVCKEKGIIIMPEICQVKVSKRWEKNSEYIISGEMDIYPVILTNDEDEHVISIVDLKTTGDLDNDFGEYSWGNFRAMDHNQAFTYLYLVEDIDIELNMQMGNTKIVELSKMFKLNDMRPEFNYWVFEYKKATLRNKMFRVLNTPDRRAEMNENIRKTVELLETYYCDERWDQTFPSSENCRSCADMDCELRYTFNKAAEEAHETL